MTPGHLTLRPGHRPPTILGGRPELAPRITVGRRADELPALLAAVFALCGHAHRLTARAAVAAARGQVLVSCVDDTLSLHAHTARDLLLRIELDGPRQLGDGDADAATQRLAACPLWQREAGPAERLAALRGWIERDWLGLVPALWLRHHDADPAHWPLQWAAQRPASPVAQGLLRQAGAATLLTGQRPLQLLRDPGATMPALAAAMAGVPGFCRRPTWAGRPAETGPWTRALDPVPQPAHNALMRRVSRIVEVLRIAASGGRGVLSHGALPLGGGAGIAWTEMARGLLVHRVQLDGDRVADCRVLAPTEWNFHPQGVLAHALAGLDGTDAERRARQLAVAFDPCVGFSVEPLCAAVEPGHA